MGDVIRYGTTEPVPATRLPSPSIWNDCHPENYRTNPAKGFHLFDDFKNSAVAKAHATDFISGLGIIAGDMNWNIYATSDKQADVALQADDEGVLMLDTDGTDDDNTMLSTGDNAAGIIRSPKIGEGQKFWFETRFKINTITASDIALFFGLCEPGQLGAAGILGAAPTAPTDVDYIGFFSAELDTTDLELVYNEATSGVAQSSSSAITMAADTWYKVGMKVVVKGNKVEYRWFLDGVDLGDSYAITLDGAANANWPGDTNMDVVFAITSGASGADSDNIKLDWVRVAQDY